MLLLLLLLGSERGPWCMPSMHHCPHRRFDDLAALAQAWSGSSPQVGAVLFGLASVRPAAMHICCLYIN